MREGFGLGLWKVIRKWWPLVSDKIFFVVGNEEKIRFWRGRWCRISFPTLYAIAMSKDA